MKRSGWWLAVVLAVGCGSVVDVIDHGGGGDSGGDGDGGESEDGGGVEGDAPELRGGNFPEPALTVCGTLPAGVEPIADLATAWVVMGERPAGSTEAPVAATRARLRFGSVGLESDELPATNDPPGECGQIGWMTALDLPDPLVPGIYPLAELTASYPETYEGFAEGCGFGGTWGTANTPAMAGELEIFAVTDTCVMGEFRGAVSGPSDIIQLQDGGFVAQRDGVACVPMLTLDCG